MSAASTVPATGKPKAIGIDVAKGHVDVAVPGLKSVKTFNNNPKGHAEVVDLLKAHTSIAEPISIIVMEATGGYEVPLAVTLQAEGLPVAIVNPKQARDFARGMGKRAKTDKVDALMLSRYGEVLATSEDLQRWLKKPMDEQREWLSALVTRRRQLILMLQSEKQRLEQTPKRLHSSIQAVIETLEAQLKDIDDQMTGHVNCHYEELNALLQSVSGVGPQTGATLIAELPELGKLTRKQIAALVGVAPYAKESGTSKGRRMIQGGRFSIRRTLYMATLVASRSNPIIRAYYLKLKAAGKLPKVALVACMRKLLTILNAMVRDNKPWDASREPPCESGAAATASAKSPKVRKSVAKIQQTVSFA